MIRLVGCNCCSPPSRYLPRVEARVVTVSRKSDSLPVSLGSNLRPPLSSRYARNWWYGARDSHSSDPVHHVDNYAVPRPRYRIRIQSPLKSMVWASTYYCFSVVRVPYSRGVSVILLWVVQ